MQKFHVKGLLPLSTDVVLRVTSALLQAQDGASSAGSSCEAGPTSRRRVRVVHRLLHLPGVWPDVRRHQVLWHLLRGDSSLLRHHGDGKLLDHLHHRGNHSHRRWVQHSLSLCDAHKVPSKDQWPACSIDELHLLIVNITVMRWMVS